MSTAYLGIDQLASADRIWHLRQTSLMEDLSDADLNAVAGACKDRIYSKDDIIFRQGDRADALFILNRGSVRISVINESDREKILGVLARGNVFGEELLDSDGRYRTQATVHEECWVSIISRQHFLSLIEQRTSIAISYMKILSHRLGQARQDVEAHSFLDTEHRLAQVLLKMAREHGKPVLGDSRRVKLKIALSHEHLARLIGGNRPHVSMIMSRFKKQGWISYQGRKLVIDVPRMRLLLGEVEDEVAAA